MDGADDTGLERLDDLGAAAGNDLAGGDRHDIDLAEAGPGERQRKDGGPANRRGRRVGQPLELKSLA
jgi:hypothetical protein